MELLVFELDDNRFALPIDVVQEVVRAVEVTALPGAPSVVHGLIDVRGSVTPVFDLRARLGHPSREIGLADQLVLAIANGRAVALQVDQVQWISSVADAEVSRTAEGIPHADHVAGVVRLPDGLAVIHDLASFLSDDEIRQLDQAVAADQSNAASGIGST